MPVGQMTDGRPAARSGLLDLVEPARWQRLQDYFANVLGLPIRTLDRSHQLLVSPSWPQHLDRDEIVRVLQVGDELGSLLPPLDPPRETASVTTRLGVTYAAVPIITQHVLGYIVLGPMMVGRREDEVHFRQRMQTMGLSAERVWPAILSLKHYTFAGIHSVLSLMEAVADSLVQLAEQTRSSSEASSAAAKPRALTPQLVARYTDRVFASLLSAATLATKADGGSVMVRDPHTGGLRISMAHGLPDDIVKSTTIDRGQGLAGLAAESRRILIVDDQTHETALRSRMNRPEVVSSVIAPVEAGGNTAVAEPVGILNLRTGNPERRFTPEHVEVLRNLLDLASLALGNLQQPTPAPTAPQSS